MSYTDQNLYSDEQAGPPDESGLLGEPISPNNSGLVGTPNSPDNSGLVGSGQTDVAAGVGDIGEDSAELPDQQLLQPGYNPPVGDAGRLRDVERGGPNPGGYSGAPGQPGIPDQAGTLDQTTYSNRTDDNAPAGPDADMRANDTDERTGY